MMEKLRIRFVDCEGICVAIIGFASCADRATAFDLPAAPDDCL